MIIKKIFDFSFFVLYLTNKIKFLLVTDFYLNYYSKKVTKMTLTSFFKRLVSKNKALFLATIITSTFSALDGIISPYIIGQITNTLSQKRFSNIPKVLVLYLCLMLFLNINFYLWQLFWGKITKSSNLILRSTAFNNFAQAPDSKKMSNTLNFINVNVKQIESQCIDSTIMLIYCIEQTIVSLIYIFSINGIAAFVFLVCGLIPAAIPRLTRKWIQTGTKNWNKSYENYNLKVSDAVHGFETIRHANGFNKFKALVQNALVLEEKKYFLMNFRRNTSNFYAQIAYSLSMVISLSVGTYFVVQGQILVGGLISLFLASDRLTSPIISIVNISNQLTSVSPLFKNEALKPAPQKSFDNLKFTHLPAQEKIIFENCDLGYAGRAILNDINFTISKGEKVLITGRSGVGKSTLIKTLLNEIPLISGEILVDETLNRSNFLTNFGIIGQDTYIFSDTLRFNLTLGNDIPLDKLINILKTVKLDYLADEKHLEMVIGEKGLSLSGGEKRKVEIARALLHDKPILLVDEGLSGLDENSNHEIFSLLQGLHQTIIEIEHAVSPAEKEQFDQIINLK